jgi:4-hydroxy-tetrahydrodipicolinate reductase
MNVVRDVRFVVVGLGPIGLAALRSTVTRPGMRLVGAIDIDPDLVGRDAGEVAGLSTLGVPISPSLERSGPRGSADVAILCTGSFLRDVTSQITACLEWGATVVSSCEELSYPWFHHPDEAQAIDDAARKAERAAIGTGVNPGFAMDALALAVSGVADSVESLSVHRVVDAATRRGPLQLKVGAGIDVDAFRMRREAGKIGHIGLVESAAMVGAGFGWTLDSIEESLQPVLADKDISTDMVDVTSGSVAGIHQHVVATAAGRQVVELDLKMYVGAPDPGDTVRLEGDPPITASINGLHGDVATAAIVANTALAAPQLRPGLRTMLDLQPMRAVATSALNR